MLLVVGLNIKSFKAYYRSSRHIKRPGPGPVQRCHTLPGPGPRLRCRPAGSAACPVAQNTSRRQGTLGTAYRKLLGAAALARFFLYIHRTREDSSRFTRMRLSCDRRSWPVKSSSVSWCLVLRNTGTAAGAGAAAADAPARRPRFRPCFRATASAGRDSNSSRQAFVRADPAISAGSMYRRSPPHLQFKEGARVLPTPNPNGHTCTKEPRRCGVGFARFAEDSSFAERKHSELPFTSTRGNTPRTVYVKQ